jgi:hypothetical protein
MSDITKVQLAAFWASEFAPHGHCCLCGNRGIIDTAGKTFTPAGVDVGAKVFCICPNGRARADSAPPLSFDARDWAKSFCKMYSGDEETMTAWFADALMRGYDQKAAEIRAERDEIVGHLGAAKAQRAECDDKIIADHIDAAYDAAKGMEKPDAK